MKFIAVLLRVVAVTLVIGYSQPVVAQRERVRLYPIDEAAQVPSFKTYRDELQRAVASRDANTVLAMMHPELRPRFDMSLRFKGLDDQEYEDWTALEELLRLGGTFTAAEYFTPNVPLGRRPRGTREFCAPYTWSAFPSLPDSLVSEVEPWVILGRNVLVRARPPTDMRVLTWLDYDLVHLASTADPHNMAPPEWIGIATPDGARGYVAARLIRDPVDYHACFGEFGGTWLITEFSHRVSPG